MIAAREQALEEAVLQEDPEMMAREREALPAEQFNVERVRAARPRWSMRAMPMASS